METGKDLPLTNESELRTLIVQIRIDPRAADACWIYGMPMANRIAPIILAETFRRALQLPENTCAGLGEFNESTFLIVYGQAALGFVISTVKDVLEKTGLLDLAVLLHYCKNESFFRVHHHGSAIAPVEIMTVEKLYAEIAAAGRENEAYMELLRLIGERVDAGGTTSENAS